ncbi:MAG TPA: bacillithiol biosynthesis cysteine-adding enzyme BshC [Gemmatimonadales bacterium]|nr:bacillithiol biosynthesis cysteine-adding enzyme BshC [Gemmatimonadales bacterium]
MSLRIEVTPLGAAVPTPSPREGGLAPALLEALVRAPGTEAALARLAEPGTLVVTTGQQPGLFTGPLYTIHKALSAAALARVLERRWERPVVPIFWSAGDDHDYAEASAAAWLAPDGALRHAELPPRDPAAPQLPMYREPLGTAVEEPLARLLADLPPSEFRDGTAEWLRRHYRPEASIAGAYTGALAELLAPLGIVVLDSTHRAVKAAAAPHLLAALRRARELDARLAAQADVLRAEGAGDAGIAFGDGATLVMLEAAQGRDRLVAEGGREEASRFVARRSGEAFTLAELERLAAEAPERLSANVLLRPVVESAILPTVAYVAGPGELRYLRLTPPIYEALGVARQTPVPRWSGVVVEPRVARVLEKFGLGLDALLDPASDVERELVRSQLPEAALEALEALRVALDRGYAVLGEAAVGIDPTLARPIESFRTQALQGTRDAERKLVQHLKRRQETELQQLARARTAVRPDGKPQERVLTIAPWLARYGPGLLDELAQAVHGWYAGALEGAPTPA